MSDESAGESRSLPPLGAGRRAAGLALLRWLDDPGAPRLCLLTGRPGSGRTHLLSWLALAGLDRSAPRTQQAHAILPAAGHTARSAAWLLAEQLNLTAAGGTPEAVAAELAEDERRTVLLVGELDRAADPAGLISQLLLPLLKSTHLRMVVDGAGAADFGDVAGEPAVLDLDEERWTDRDAFARWYGRLPQPPELADHEGAFGPEAAYPSPGPARLARCVPTGATAGDVPTAWWAAVPDELRPTLRALVSAESPVGRDEWAVLPGSGGAELVARASEWLPPHTPSGDTWWLPEYVRSAAGVAGAEAPAAHEAAHEAALLALAGAVPRESAAAAEPSTAAPAGAPDFAAADPDLLGHLLRHALAAGRAQELLADPDFLVHADPVAVTAALDRTGAHRGDGPSAALHQAWYAAGRALLGTDSAAERAAVLAARLLGGADEAAAASLHGRLDRLHRFAPEQSAPWQAQWARWDLGAVVAVSAGRHRQSGQLLVSDEEGVVRALDPATGATLAEHGRLADSMPAVLHCTPDGEVIALDSPFSEPDEAARGVVRWGGHAAALHTGPVNCLAAALLRPDPDADRGVPLLFSGGADGTVRLWSPGAEPAPAEEADTRPSPVTAVALADSTGMTAAAWADGTLHAGPLGLHLGSPVLALAFSSATTLAVGLADGLVLLSLRG